MTIISLLLAASFTLGSPRPATIRVTTNPEENEWLSSNAVFVATAGYVATNCTSSIDYSQLDRKRVILRDAEAGYSADRVKPQYYLLDSIEPPEEVDWAATETLYDSKFAKGSGPFLFNTDELAPAVYAILGGFQTMTWVLKNGEQLEVSYTIASNSLERPRRIYWTDSPYNQKPINLNGKFVKLYGNQDLIKCEYGEKVTNTGGVVMTNQNCIVRGLYVDDQAQVLKAAGELSGQCVIAYYDTGEYKKLLSVQVVEVCKPQINVLEGTVGTALKPHGGGYNTEGLIPVVQAGIGDGGDDGDYVYQHKGKYSYSPKNNAVFPLRTADASDARIEICWQEEDALGVRWPFEIDHYNVKWPKEEECLFVRGDTSEDSGAKIFIPEDYQVELQKFHDAATKPEVNSNSIDTKGPGWSLVKLSTTDNVWFMPIYSALRTDFRFYDTKSSRVTVGREIAPRYGSRSGIREGVKIKTEADIPGYVYRGTSYDVNLYKAATNAVHEASAIYPISTNDMIEVWWSRRFKEDDMPEAVCVPVLPQIYNPVWPKTRDVPQIVIASQKGSANETIHCFGAAAFFDSENASIQLPNRNYFPNGEGTIAFWTRYALYDSDAELKQSNLISLADGQFALSVTKDNKLRLNYGNGIRMVELPNSAADEWVHLAVSFNEESLKLYVNGEEALDYAYAQNVLKGYLYGNYIGSGSTAIGRQIAELVTFKAMLDKEGIAENRYKRFVGNEADMTALFRFDILDEQGVSFERVHNEQCKMRDVVAVEPGAPSRFSGLITSDETPKIYYQNDKTAVGYNPNDEHAFISSGSGGYVAWALRCDLNLPEDSAPAVFVEYTENARPKLQMFNVVLTNETWNCLGAKATAGLVLPGPHPLDTFEAPWLEEDYWDAGTGEAAGPAYRDRKKQIWARAKGTLPIYMYYRNQAGFYFPSLGENNQPEVGTPVPWLSMLDEQATDPLKAAPAAWVWDIDWPKECPEMRIGQTLTVAAEGLPEVWGAKSMSVVYPDPVRADETVMLTDPTVIVSTNFDYRVLGKLGLTTDNNGGLTMKMGKYYFTDLPPHLSNRFYVDATNNKLCFMGKRETSNAGASILYPNVISAAERKLILELVPELMRTGTDYETWVKTVSDLATAPVKPNQVLRNGSEISTVYKPIDHYALTAMGKSDHVVLIENDAKESDNMGVNDGDPITMQVLKVLPEYYEGRIVTREDEVNLLSQQLSVVYTEPFGGKADDFIFEWKKARPNADGTIPDQYDDEQIYKTRAGFPDAADPRFVIGGQGDTLDNMVNTYFICRYKAKEGTSAYKTMGDIWSGWCAPPALAEGWVQRVLNNVTPFNQRMTDLYNNPAETPVSMIQQAGAPYTGDVALNQDNLTSVGLIQLYETILNKAESMSLSVGINDTDANKQLLLAAERLDDLYVLLGDEAYSDAKNPTIGFGSNMAEIDNRPNVDFGAASSSLFCFDNQVRTLLDEELALLRGRTGDSAPVTTTAPYYNRLLWNFTKGITAGEVAYAVNYNIEGKEKTALSEEQAARLYPQGHGDAYGHYLSALKGWYRLLRNPNFTWARAQGEMNVADSAINVDYYEEAKFAAAAEKLAKTARDVVDLTARKSWRDNEGDLHKDYLDENENRAFGSGEWAFRGAYGALVNWATANSLLPEHESGSELKKIDRETVSELEGLCIVAADIQSAADRMDFGLNPLGLSDRAVPFDITPKGASDGSFTHFDQIRERSEAAFKIAEDKLDAAQESSNRLRMIQESSDSYVESIEVEEAVFTKELIGYYGTPYSDDIGPGKTYPQGYEGPDLVHYMWMDIKKYGLTDVKDTETFEYKKYSDFKSRTQVATVSSALSNTDVGEITYEVTYNGLVKKPDNITGRRLTQGSIQERYEDFLLQYFAVKRAMGMYELACQQLENELTACKTLLTLYTVYYTAQELLNAYQVVKAASDYVLSTLMVVLENTQYTTTAAENSIKYSVPATIGAGMTVITSPRSIVEGAVYPITESTSVTLDSMKTQIKFGQAKLKQVEETSKAVVEAAKTATAQSETYNSLAERLKSAVSAVNAAANDTIEALAKLNVCVEAYNKEVANGETCLGEREAARKRHVNALNQYRYNDMFFRLLRNEELSDYSAKFDLAQKYAYLAAQAYDYETTLLSSDAKSGDKYRAKIIGARSLGELEMLMKEMDENWLVLKPRLGINNPQPYATWFSLRGECFRILPGEEGDKAWAKELTKYWVDDIASDENFKRYCQPFQSQFGLKEKEPGLIIPFETTIDFAKNFFALDLAGGDSAYDSTWYSTKIAAAGLWFDDYNAKANGYAGAALLSTTPVAYLVPVGMDCFRVPGLEDGEVLGYDVMDQVVPLPNAIGSAHLDEGVDAKIRRHPSFRAYYGEGEPTDDKLDATRLIGRSVWNTKWMLVIPAGGMNADRDKALSVFINGSDVNRDGKLDLKPVRDIRLGFKTYSTSGN